MYICIHIYIHIYRYIFTYIHIHIFAYIYIHIYIYTHIYICIYTHNLNQLLFCIALSLSQCFLGFRNKHTSGPGDPLIHSFPGCNLLAPRMVSWWMFGGASLSRNQRSTTLLHIAVWSMRTPQKPGIGRALLHVGCFLEVVLEESGQRGCFW